MSAQNMPQASSNEQTQETKQHDDRSGRHGSRRRFQNQPRRPDPALNMEELRELVELIAEHGFTDFELEKEGFRVRLRRDLAPQTPAPVAATVLTPVSQMPAPASTSVASPPTETLPNMTSAQPSVPVTTEAVNTEVKKEEDLHIIASPIVGTFYRAASPASEPFVRVGSHVEPDTVVCIIEAMKLMNEIQAETSGVIEKIYVENGQPVEYGQPLFGIKR